MIRTEQIVVDGLRNPIIGKALIAHFLHIFADFVASVHGVVSAVIEEIARRILENLQNPFVISVVYIGFRHFIAAGTQQTMRGIFQKRKLSGVLLSHIEQTVVQYADDTSSQDPGDEVFSVLSRSRPTHWR